MAVGASEDVVRNGRSYTERYRKPLFSRARMSAE